jgi:hypothetical protein
MSNGYWKLAGGNLFQDWSDTSLISAADDWSKVPSIVGYRGDGLTALTGTDPRTVTGTSSVVNVIANQTNPNTLTTGGVAEFQIANPVVALQGSGTATAPYLELFLDATGRENVTLSFEARDIDGSTDNAVQPIAVQFRLGDTGSWANVPGGYIADATTGPGLATAVTPLSVVLPTIANNAANLQVRIMTTNAVGSDEWVGIDNISVTSAAPVTKVPGALSIADASTGEGDAGSHPISFTVSRIGGASGAVDAHYAVALPGGTNGADANDFAAGTALSGTVHFDDGQATATISLPVLGDTNPEFDEHFTVTLSDPTGGATINRATATGTIFNDDVLPLLIGQIQGAGHTSPVAGQTVQTQGVVTGVDANGFYLQDFGDGDARTSDGIFVFTGTAPDVYVGDYLSVKGAVTEYQAGTGGLTVTEINKADISLISWGNALPDAVVIGDNGLHPPTQVIEDDGFKTFDPTTDGIDFWESLEGMRVTIDHPMAVSNTTNDSFAETDVVASDGRGATGINDRGGITISQGDYNPEKIQIDGHSALFAGFDPHYTVGDQLSSVTGIVNYAAANYEVLVTEPVTVEKDVTLTREVTNLVGDASHLSLATYNLENLDASDNKYDTLAGNIVTNLGTPDILAVQEIQDADGAGKGTNLSGVPTAQGLIDAIDKISGAHYAYVEIAPSAPNTTGGEPNGNIRSGYLYNLDRVHYVEGSAELITGSAYNNSRNPLVAQFEFNGQTITTIDVHLTSRGGSDPLWGATQPPADAGDASRTAQAAGVKAYIQEHLADNPNLNIAVLGDWNGFSYENAQTQLTDPTKGGVLTDLNTLLPEQERYSYLFDGNAQQIDHILVTKGLLPNAQYDAVHINSQFAENDRPTDHDPQLAVLTLGAQPTQGAQVAAMYSADEASAGSASAPAGDSLHLFGAAQDPWLMPHAAMFDNALHLV